MEELIAMALRRADASMPSRQADEKDYDYHYLQDVYQQILDWDAKGRLPLTTN